MNSCNKFNSSEINTYALVLAGLEKTAQQEIKELLHLQAASFHSVLEFPVKNKEELIYFMLKSQSVRRFLVALGKFKSFDEINFDPLVLKKYFSSEISFKIEVENVKGQDNRVNIAQKVGKVLFASLGEIKPLINFKKPDLRVIVFFNDQEYFVGIDVSGKELNSREYRLFPHSASFKGDIGYYFIRRSKFVPKRKIMIGFVKDGTLAIETALFADNLPVHHQDKSNFSFNKFPLFYDFDLASFIAENFPVKEFSSSVYAFDESLQNITAARKNAGLAKVNLNLQKLLLDDLDVKFKKNEFDHLIFYITIKDEKKINEIYYQADYILKSRGMFLIIGRKNFDLPLSERFKLLSKEEIQKGESSLVSWLLEKK